MGYYSEGYLEGLSANMNIWDDIQLLDRLEEQRALRRLDGRLTFDCLNLKYKDSRACCSKGKLLGQARDGSLALIVVLGGVTSGICRNCEDFITEEEI